MHIEDEISTSMQYSLEEEIENLSPSSRRTSPSLSMKEQRAIWKKANREQHRECQRQHRVNVRKEILTLLAGALRCQSCGYDKDYRCLQIDHIHGGGRHDPRTKGGNTNLWTLRNWIKKYPIAAKEMYQVLCANCNWIKKAELGEHLTHRDKMKS